ncbi:hypothetical protein EVU94_04360 [Flavobacteriaceae bacterium 144Ye]|nr:hypothetical protein EVU94_04360 [Flavobacteriaceae bacterium 144Ye]
MLKFSIKVVIFFTLIFLLVLGSGRLFLDKKNRQYFKNEEYDNNKENFEIAIFGSSHAFSTYDPRIFENELKVNVYNYGAATQNLIITKALIENEIKKRGIKLGIVDIFSATLSEPPFSERESVFQLQTMDYMNLSLDKIKLFNNVFGKDSLLSIFPIIREHALWKDRVFQTDYYLKNEIDYYKGFYTQIDFDKKKWIKNADDAREYKNQKLKENIQLTTYQKNVIDDIINLFKSKNTALIFVSAPMHKKYLNDNYYTFQKRIKEYLKDKNVPFIDYNELWDELEFHTFDFRDIDHLNLSGAVKVSQHLSAYTKSHFKLNESDEIVLSKNRYTILDNPNKIANAIQHELVNKKVKEQTGIDKLIIYKDNYDRLEILIVGKSLKDISIKASYDIQENTKRQLAKDIQKNINKGKYSKKEFLQNRKKLGTYKGMQYQGNEFKAFVIDCPFNEIRNFNVTIGAKSPTYEILKIEKLKFD